MSTGKTIANSSSDIASENKRDQFGSRLGFILISAGCAIGLGNVWRFPFITGQYGGAAFVVMYVFFLVAFTLPILVMEFAVGRGAQKSAAQAFDILEPKGSRWHRAKWISGVGSLMLLMFYTTVAGWMLAYIYKSATGTFVGLDAQATAGVFTTMLLNPGEMTFWMLVVVAIGLVATAAGLQKGVERITKGMMVCLFAVMILLAIRSVTLDGARAGLEFYLVPDFGKLVAGATFGEQLANFSQAAYAAMGQAFFTMSLGIGCMTIFGSYIDKTHTLASESIRIGALDTFVAFMAGLIIFPACFAFGVEPGAGPGLVFITLPSVFNQMPLGQLWCALFFVFMSFAALSTIIAVFEHLIAFASDQWGLSRSKAVAIVGVLVTVLSFPCVFGFNIWSDFTVPGIGDIQSLEDFIVSNNLLPLGSLVFLLFCVSKSGWGWDNFVAEADTGKGVKFPRWTKNYMRYVAPALILVVFVMGWIPVIQLWIAG